MGFKNDFNSKFYEAPFDHFEITGRTNKPEIISWLRNTLPVNNENKEEDDAQIQIYEKKSFTFSNIFNKKNFQEKILPFVKPILKIMGPVLLEAITKNAPPWVHKIAQYIVSPAMAIATDVVI